MLQYLYFTVCEKVVGVIMITKSKVWQSIDARLQVRWNMEEGCEHKGFIQAATDS